MTGQQLFEQESAKSKLIDKWSWDSLTSDSKLAWQERADRLKPEPTTRKGDLSQQERQALHLANDIQGCLQNVHQRIRHPIKPTDEEEQRDRLAFLSTANHKLQQLRKLLGDKL